MNGARLLLHLMGKEARNVVRDRRSLFVAVLLPLLVFPLLLIGGGRGMMAAQQAEQLRTVALAADEATREQWRALHHEWFLQSEIGGALRVAGSPLWQQLRGRTDTDATELQRVLADPRAYEDWLRGVTDHLRAALEDPTALLAGLDPDEQQSAPTPQAARAFFDVAIKGLALVEWVDPADLPAPPPDAEDVILTERWNDDEGRALAHALRTRRIAGAMRIDGTTATIADDHASQLLVHLLHDASDTRSGEARGRVDRLVSASRESVLSVRLRAQQLPWTFVEPVRRAPGGDIATPGRMASMIAGMLVPYLVLVFAFVGGLYPAVELGAGEKERGTLETLLLAPVGRTMLAVAKFCVVCTAAMLSALMGLIALGVTVRFGLPPEAAAVLSLQISSTQVALLVVLLLPPAMASAGMLLAISVNARSFREAQNYLAPVQLFFILPAAISTFPGIDLTPELATIPIVNVALAARDVIRGTWDPAMIAITFVSCAALATVCVALCVRQFHREAVLFRL